MVHYYPTLEMRKRNPTLLYPKSSPILTVIYRSPPPPPRGEKERPQSAYPKYSLILMFHHDPTQEQKKTDPGFPVLEATCFRSLAK